jgi:hypothetical protein
MGCGRGFFKLPILVGENRINPPHPMSTKTTHRNFLKTAAVATIYAARAGKEIYCEKPCAMNILECHELDDTI